MINNGLKIVQHYIRRCLSVSCYCILCLAATRRDIGLCVACEQRLPWLVAAHCYHCALPIKDGEICLQCQHLRPPYERVQALFNYRWPVNKFVSRLKYHGDLHFAKLLGSLMKTHLTPTFPIDCVMAVPLHQQRQEQRGFNQSLELAKIIADHWSLPVDRNSCQRKRSTVTQAQLTANKRRMNITERNFVVARTFKAQHVLLIDDVMTTGATLSAVANALKKVGVVTVEAWVCCRAPFGKF